MESRAYLIPCNEADAAIRGLMRSGIIRKDLKIRKIDGFIAVPVKDEDQSIRFETANLDFEERRQENVKDMMRNALVKEYRYNGPIPDRWVRYGNAVFLDKHVDERVFRVMKRFLGVESIYVYRGISGPERIPVVEFLYGKRGDVVHTENGIRFRFDPERIMFSPGNTNERTRMRSISFKGETVLDMFSGIGYFTLPIAKYGDPARVFACDINPDAIHYLRQNAVINGVGDLILPILGDSRVTCPEGPFDSIIMGNFKSLMYLPAALRRSRENTRIVLHHLVSQENLGRYRYDIMSYTSSLGYLTVIEDSHIVKSYAPKMFHVSTTLRILRITG
ncbi:class I SAM-dependent methyltransferase family protein [Thermoplasma sp.]|uniref:class I SAM-dependent methyltransferase n=1 Tax=Thermoplasma sp. TaxID=1973142 RepID=UPI001270E3A0|nr:class I SAM-dependent methyltransferase family protein [Thermoplasma sp.]KAA8923164.1 MAG: class I SAM-dependent methyltransferase family protein [Thermoplasma sp.]